jgi:signal recognition particle subunit SRP54
MTLKERRNPDLINSSRKQRIAKGCGMQAADVNRLLRQFEDMRGMMKKLSSGGGRGSPRLPAGLGALGGLGGLPAPGLQGTGGGGLSGEEQRKLRQKRKEERQRKKKQRR